MKSTGIAYLTWFFGLHYLYLGRWGTWILFVLSCTIAVGFLWWVIDLFRIPGLVAQANMKSAHGSMNANRNDNINTNVVNVNIDADLLRRLQQPEVKPEA
jgi:hypothetical protein